MGIFLSSKLFSTQRVRLSILFVLVCLSPSLGPGMAKSLEKPSSPSKASPSLDPGTDNLQHQIDDIEDQIQKLRKQSLELQEKTRTKMKEQLNYLQQQRDTLVPRIEKLRDNSETAWVDIKENIQKAIEELKQSVEVLDK